jgi:hypothetical protein
MMIHWAPPAMVTKLWCFRCQNLQKMEEVVKRVWGTWRCEHCKTERGTGSTPGTVCKRVVLT